MKTKYFAAITRACADCFSRFTIGDSIELHLSELITRLKRKGQKIEANIVFLVKNKTPSSHLPSTIGSNGSSNVAWGSSLQAATYGTVSLITQHDERQTRFQLKGSLITNLRARNGIEWMKVNIVEQIHISCYLTQTRTVTTISEGPAHSRDTLQAIARELCFPARIS